MVPNYVIDTDPGIDDAMAIMMALDAHIKGTINIVAFTLVAGNTEIENSKVNMLRIMDLYPQCQEIPIYLGASEGLVHRYHHHVGRFHGVDGFNGAFFDKEYDAETMSTRFQREPAAISLVQLSKKHKDLCLITLGPLTNIALAMKIDEGFASRISRIFTMGGNFEAIGNATISAEFNFYADPEAAFVVLNHVKCPLMLVTWELCYKYFPMSKKWRQDVLGNVPTKQASLMNVIEEAWLCRSNKRYEDQWVACDQLIVAVAIDSNCVKTTEDFHATVELHGTSTRGQVVVDKRFFHPLRENPNVTVVTELNAELVKRYMLSGLGHSV